MITKPIRAVSMPQRVVIVGSNGFIGKHIYESLRYQNCNILSLTRNDINLLDNNAYNILKGYLKTDDALVICVAEAPVKNTKMFRNNIIMMDNICKCISEISLKHVLYVSSDAVYSDSNNPLTETSIIAPDNLHGIMHAAREIMLKSVFQGPLAFLRPTLVYGDGDPHNGYGPNRFRRTAAEGVIKLFGNGEEQRDHIHVLDVAELATRMIFSGFSGSLNAATGTVFSFFEIAEAIASSSRKYVEIIKCKRSGPMPHNGFRPFDTSLTKKIFPDFKYTNLIEWLKISENQK